MSLATSNWIYALVVANFVTAVCRGQNYADRSGNVHAGDVAYITEDESEYGTEDYYDWSHVADGVWRWNVEDYPHPQWETAACRRKAPSNVCDPDAILTEEQGDELDAFIRKIYNETACICKVCESHSGGIQIGVALLKYIYQPYNEHPSKIIHSFSKNLRSKWRLGECEDDLLIVVATEDRQSYTDVGRTTKYYISRAEAYRIFLESKAYFTDGRYFEGLRDMLQHYHRVTRNIAKDKQSNKGRRLSVGEATGIVLASLLIVFIIVIVAVWFYKRYKRSQDSNTSRNDKNKPDMKSPGWLRKDIKVLLPFRQNPDAYQPCKTHDEESGNENNAEEKKSEQEIINTELAPRETSELLPPPPPPEESANDENGKKLDSPATPTSERTDSGCPPSAAVTSSESTANTPKLDSFGHANTNGTSFSTFVPKKPTHLHQTDL